jgi:hypothetical protein
MGSLLRVALLQVMIHCSLPEAVHLVFGDLPGIENEMYSVSNTLYFYP